MCPTLSGSASSVWKFLQAPEQLYEDPDLVANVPVDVGKNLYFTIRVLKLPGVARLLLHQPDPMRQWNGGTSRACGIPRSSIAPGGPLVFGTEGFDLRPSEKWVRPVLRVVTPQSSFQ